MNEQKPCGSALIELLADYGIDTVFGIPGVHTLAFFKSVETTGIRHIGARHEQGAGFMADGYARASGRPGVCLLISGPGVTNAATPIGQAYSDSVPMLVITSAIALAEMGLGRGMLHEISDQRATTAPLTSLSVMAFTSAQVPEHMAHAMALFATCRPRPVHVSVPLDVLDMPAAKFNARPNLPAAPSPDMAMIKRAATLLATARRPLLLLGGGATGASAALIKLAERLNAPVVTTVAGKGIVPESHPLSLGSTLQRPLTRALIEQEADVVLAVGTEISEPDLYVTADSEAGATQSDQSQTSAAGTSRLHLRGQLVRIDIDPATTVRDYVPAIAIAADAQASASALLDELSAYAKIAAAWDTNFEEMRSRIRAQLSPLERQHVLVLDAIRRALPRDALLYADMTQIAYTGCVFFPVEVPRSWHFPLGYGTLGYAVPAAIGGALACPGRPCVALVGDGGLLFTLQEIATAVEQRLPLVIVLWDNDGLGEIADFMRARQIPEISVRPINPDFIALAKAFGCRAAEPESLKEIQVAIREAMDADGPTLVRIRQDAKYLTEQL
ncbi:MULTISPECIES: 5-guanidino-2-oxopentanoate decarboxylase [unclassified Caballeronia]|uniref:5-guanidino-2-oxopentanoate decarboxylase n=1 Tax=unclassified Caballeronia TaxID=2646786 RepID=UPI0020285568|nr:MULTISPECIES: 5-guanidino-2-oxopentanoate decarboxylase [unclassified Caballeronia]